MRKPDRIEEMRRELGLEIVQIAIPVLCEAVAVIFAIGVAALWLVILATPVPI